jgi:regulator of replication initiation timing
LTEDKAQTVPEVSPVMQQIGMLNLRINDMMTQLNAVMKMLVDENNALKKESADLKAKTEKTSKA